MYEHVYIVRISIAIALPQLCINVLDLSFRSSLNFCIKMAMDETNEKTDIEAANLRTKLKIFWKVSKCWIFSRDTFLRTMIHM